MNRTAWFAAFFAVAGLALAVQSLSTGVSWMAVVLAFVAGMLVGGPVVNACIEWHVRRRLERE